MKTYEAPQAQVVSFDNDYVATASSRSRVAITFGVCESGDQTWVLTDYACGPYSSGGDS